MAKKVLVTAGSTQVKIDQVRVISNIFTGKTGTSIAQYFAQKGCHVCLITSNPKIVSDKRMLRLLTYKTFADLDEAMEHEIRLGNYSSEDIIIHSAAVSDYQSAGVFVSQQGKLKELDASDKVASTHNELFLKLVPTHKLIDQIRTPWGFQGTLVKFKLQVNISDDQLISIAQKSRQDSQADWIVANCLEWAKERAIIIGADNKLQNVSRDELAEELYRRVVP